MPRQLSQSSADRPELLDIGALMCFAAAHRPVSFPDNIVERTVVARGLGLLIGEERDRTTLLYLWQHEQTDFLAWLAHVARWVALYPHWRRAQGLQASHVPVRIILAVSSVTEGLREALTVLSSPVTVARYRCENRGGTYVLAWDRGSVADGILAEDSAGWTTPAGGSAFASTDDALTPEERNFFQQFV